MISDPTNRHICTESRTMLILEKNEIRQALPMAEAVPAMKRALAKAGIKKEASPHTLRHSWATGMLEAGVDLLTISKILGHASFVTTMVYLHVRREHFERTPSPIDWLPVRQCPKWVQPAAPQDETNPPNDNATKQEPTTSQTTSSTCE